ncbi:MAG: hypothetical protein QM647_02360 [Asticcacaulis sp.]|uniref:hypothetical protein n=1 Tax=Asticcacaulis sp. TaxID=1872648 RepID=UPI0039E2E2F5
MISLLASLLIAAEAVPATIPAAAPDVNALTGFDTAACEGEGDARQLPRQKAIAQLLLRYPIVMDITDFSAPQTPLAQRVAQACADDTCPVDGNSYVKLNSTVAAVLASRENSQLRLSWTGEGPEPASRAERIAAFFDLSRPTYTLTCLGAAPLPPTPATVVATAPDAAPGDAKPPEAAKRATSSQWRIASTISETEKDDYTKRDPARLTYTDNASDSAPVISAKGTLAAPAIVTWGDEAVATKGFGDIRPFTSYERISNVDVSSEVNNLDVGLRGHFRFARNDGKEAYIGGLTAAYETDDRFDSSLTRFEASLTLPVKTWMDASFPALSSAANNAQCVICQTTSMTLVTDYVDVGDPGAKASLVDLPQYARAGFDAQWEVRLNRGADKPGFGLNLQYSRRADLSNQGATADRLISRAAYYPTPQSHYVFGLEYDKGKDLTSLTGIDSWMFTWGYRQ